MNFIALDVETANADYSSVCQIGLVAFENAQITDTWVTYVDPRTYFDPFNVSIHGISEHDVVGAPSFPSAYAELARRLKDTVVVHHGHFDRTAFARCYSLHSLEPIPCSWLDTTAVVRRTWKEFAASGYGLKNLSKHFDIPLDHHDALSDAVATGKIMQLCLEETGNCIEDWLIKSRRPRTSPTSFMGEGDTDGPFFGESIVFTGSLSVPRREAADAAKSLGFNVKGSVTKGTNFLCVGIQDEEKLGGYPKSSKHRKAEKLIEEGQEVQILSEADFWELAEAGTDAP